LLFTSYGYGYNKNLIHIDEENWRQILEGEWMIEFHAPWCPACRDLQKAWDSFADWSRDLNANVAEVDVTTDPGLSGRFLVTALPTIYHVKDGVFRLYAGARDKDDFINYVQDKKWSSFPPMAGWKHPDTVQMTIVSYFFKVSMSVRDLHNYFVEKQGIPPWGSYAIFGVTTLVLGCILGFLIVCLIDLIFPTTLGPAAPAAATTEHTSSSKKQQKNKEKKKQQNAKEHKNKEKKSDHEKSEEDKSGYNTQSQSEGDLSAVEEKEKENIRLRKKEKVVANGKSETGKK